MSEKVDAAIENICNVPLNMNGYEFLSGNIDEIDNGCTAITEEVERLEELANKAVDNYSKQVDKYSDLTDKYIDNKKQIAIETELADRQAVIERMACRMLFDRNQLKKFTESNRKFKPLSYLSANSIQGIIDHFKQAAKSAAKKASE